MGRLWAWAWACLLVVGFAMEARADDPGFLPVRVCVRPLEVPATVWGWGYPSGGPVLLLLRRKPWTRERFMETSYPFPVYLFDPDAPAAHTKQLPLPYRKLPCDPKPPAENKEVTEPGLATKLNAIPALPAYADPKLAEIARKGFERGFGAGLSEAKQKATAVYLAGEVALALSGEAAILAERAGAAALKGALARLKGMPVFIPGTIEGGGAFFRLPNPPIAQAARVEELTRRQAAMLDELRSGRDVIVRNAEEARLLLEHSGLKPFTSQRHLPAAPAPKGTYRGDLLNTTDPTTPFVHPPGAAPPGHALNPHYNLYFLNGKKATIIIRTD